MNYIFRNSIIGDFSFDLGLASYSTTYGNDPNCLSCSTSHRPHPRKSSVYDIDSATMNDDNSVDSDTLLQRLTKIIHPDDLMLLGLRVFYSERKLRFAKKKTNTTRFRKKFGADPLVCVLIWEDFQTTSIEAARVPEERLNAKYFLMALHHLRKYPTEDDREGPWDVSAKTAREWVWFFLEKIQALKEKKIRWPTNWGPDTWIVTVDGTHCWINEPTHPDWSQDSEYYSHKFAKAGINYELGIAIASSRLVWMNGPFKAGANDAQIFRDHGLRDELTNIAKKGIGDRGYRGYNETMSTYNPHDSRNVKKFKSRALKRHENFNNMTKRFDCLDGRFRHGADRFQVCFEAVCVICQYQLENGMPLYDVLIEDIM